MCGQSAKRKEPFDIPGFDESLRRDLQSGSITLEDAAREYYRANHTFSVDLEYTKKTIGLIAEQPSDELKAIGLVNRLGYDESASRLNNIFREANKKMELILDGCHPGLVPSGFTERNYMTEDQLREVHLLTLGMSICFDPKIEAKRKVLERINARRSRSGKPLVK